LIVVFGSINVDLVAQTARLPRPGETLAGESFALLPGGKGANQALAARRAGADVALVGAVGADVFAPIALTGLREAGVDLQSISESALPTGVALIHVDARGENCITVIAGANADAVSDAIPLELLEAGTTLLLQLELPMAMVAQAALRGRSRGARVVLNAAPAHPLPSSLLSSLDILIVNESEAAMIAADLGIEPAAEGFANEIHRRFGCRAVVTRGAQGAVAAADCRLWHAPAPLVGVVDTTGAGDAFVGALAAAIDRGAAWPRALADGVAAGALACTAAGAQAALPGTSAIANLSDAVDSNVRFQSLI
jgi:ribokinase